MKRCFSECYRIIYNIFKKSDFASELGSTKMGLAKLLGASQGKTQHWERGQWPHADDLMIIHDKLGLSYRWLVTGEGEPFDEAVTATSINQSSSPLGAPIPLIGFASCSMFGWHGTMNIPVSVELPAWHEGMVAVMASGESMLPAGIGHGQVCYCDTTKEPGQNEAVFVEQMDGSGTIKLFLGRGIMGAGEPCLKLQGWLDKEQESCIQKPFFLDVALNFVRRMAPVIYVRRRL